MQFTFYERVYFHEPSDKFPGTKEAMGHWLGVADNVGDALCFYILTDKTHQVIERSVVRSASRPGQRGFPTDPVIVDDTLSVSESVQTSGSMEREIPPLRHHTEAQPALTNPPPALRRSDRIRNRMMNHVRALEISPTTTFISTVPIDIIPEFPDATEYFAPDSRPSYELNGLDRFQREQLEYIVSLDTHNDRYDQDTHTWTPLFIYEHKVCKRRHRRLLLKVGWTEGHYSWIDADPLRIQCPFLIIDYVNRQNLRAHADFRWVCDVSDGNIREYARAFAAVVNKDAPKYKFGEIVPRNVNHALQIDAMNGNTDWQDAINKELKQIQDYRTFRYLRRGEWLKDFQRIPYHIVFDVKFDLRKKARLVAGGHLTSPPKEDLYSGVVDLMTVRIGHMLAAINGLQVCAADIGNAFLYGKTREKVYVIAGKEFGPDMAGAPLIIDRGLYGLRSSSARFHEHLSAKLRALGYRPSKADTDFWIKEFPDHYEYIATYVDDVLVYSKRPLDVIKLLQEDYILKGIGIPRYYLGGDIMQLDGSWSSNGSNVKTSLSAETYIDNAISKFEKAFSSDTAPFTFRQYSSPMDPDYHPEADTTPPLNPRQATIYRGLIGAANWVVTLGRFDVAYTVNTLARYSMAPRQGHFAAALHLFGYLKLARAGQILIDPDPQTLEGSPATTYDWTEFYPDASEELPPDAPTPKGVPVTTLCYVDADHAHDTVTRRSVSGILLFLNGMPVKWYSKRQTTVETSSYGSELVAARIAIELVIELRYKLRMLGVPIDSPTHLLGDNMSVVLNTTVPSSQLKKKHNAIAYHRVREAIAANIVTFRHIPTDRNFADILTKPVKPQIFRALCSRVLFRRPPFVPLPADDNPHDSPNPPPCHPPDTMPAVPLPASDDNPRFLPAADDPLPAAADFLPHVPTVVTPPPPPDVIPASPPTVFPTALSRLPCPLNSVVVLPPGFPSVSKGRLCNGSQSY
jgi:hypothetical protein